MTYTAADRRRVMDADDPRHGTNAGFFAHRRAGQEPCTPCYLAKNRHLKELRVFGATTLTTLPDHTWQILKATPPVVLHRQTGISARILRRLLRAGPGVRCRKDTVRKINAVRPVSPIGVTRRLQALTALGWSSVAMAEVSGLHKSVIVNRRLRVTGHYIEGRTVAAVLAMYEQLSMQLPPHGQSASQARAIAERKGWAPPMAWDDIDAPDEQPQGTVTPRNGRHASHTEARIADLEHFIGADMSLDEACRELDLTRDGLWAWCKNHNRRDLYERLARGHRRSNNQHTARGAA